MRWQGALSQRLLSEPVLLSSYARCGQERSFAFADPVGEVVATAADEVRPALSAVERAELDALPRWTPLERTH